MSIAGLAEERARVAAMLGDEVAAGTWLVGGVVRDALLERPLLDVDLATAHDVEAAARAIAKAIGGTAFALGDRTVEEGGGCWRVAPPGEAHDHAQYDVCPLRGGTLESDLAARDFTANAMAVPLAGSGALVDLHGGEDDVAHGVVRMVSPEALDEDPLRMLRAARLAHVLGWSIDDATVEAIRARAHRAGEPAGERTFAELRLLLLHGEARRGWARLEALGLGDVLLPELAACRGVEQSAFHHLDVHDHTLAVLDNAEDLLAATDFWLPLPDEDGLQVAPWSEHQRLVVLLAALCHDLGKPATRTTFGDGRVGFGGHDDVGMELVDEIARRWRWSSALRQQVRTLVGTHLALGYLLHSDRGPRERWRFRQRVQPVAAEAVVLSVADRLATAGRADRRRWVRAHLELARAVWLDHWREVRDGVPEPLLDGREILATTGIEPGPLLGRLVTALAEAQAVGSVADRDDARMLVEALAAEAE